MHIPAFVRPLFNLCRAAPVAPVAAKNLQNLEGNQASFKYQRFANAGVSDNVNAFANGFKSGKKSVFYVPLANKPSVDRRQMAPLIQGPGTRISRSLSPLSNAVYEAGISNLLPAKRLVASNKFSLRKPVQGNNPVDNKSSRLVRTVLAPRALVRTAIRDNKA